MRGLYRITQLKQERKIMSGTKIKKTKNKHGTKWIM